MRSNYVQQYVRGSINEEVQTTSGVFEPTTSASLESLDPSSRDEDQENRQPPLGVEVTGYHLLNMVVILGSGIWKILSSYPGLPITLTRMELFAATIGGTILYYFKLIHDKRPETCRRFFQDDLAPPILKFVWRREVYLFLICLIPVLAIPGAISHALNIIRDAKHGNIESGPHLAIEVLKLTVSSIMTIFLLLSLLPSVAHLETLRYYLAPIKDIDFKSLLLVICITVVFSVSSFLTSMNDAQGHDTFTGWVCVVSPSIFVIAIVLSLLKIEGSGIVSRSFRARFRVAEMILWLAIYLGLTLTGYPPYVIRGYNLTVYSGVGMSVLYLYDIVTGGV